MFLTETARAKINARRIAIFKHTPRFQSPEGFATSILYDIDHNRFAIPNGNHLNGLHKSE
jgi:hypothetical protein